MKKSSKEWVDSIAVTENQKGKDHWFTACCPICGTSEEANVHGSSSSSAKYAAKLKIVTHIRTKHADYLTDPPEKTEAEKEMGKEWEELKRDIFGDSDKPA